MADFVKPNDIINAPGVQSGKQAVLNLEANQDAFIADFNEKINEARGGHNTIGDHINHVDSKVDAKVDQSDFETHQHTAEGAAVSIEDLEAQAFFFANI